MAHSFRCAAFATILCAIAWSAQASSAERIRKIPFDIVPISDVAFSHDSKLLAVGHGREVTFFKMPWVQPVSVSTVRGDVDTLGFLPDGQTVVVGSKYKGELYLVKEGSVSPETFIKFPGRRVSPVVLAVDGSTMAVGVDSGVDADVAVELWTVGDRSKRLEIKGFAGWVWSLAFSSDGSVLASSGGDATHYFDNKSLRGDRVVWSLKENRLLWEVRRAPELISKITFCLGDKALAGVDYGGTLRIWSAINGEETARRFCGARATCLLAVNNGNHLVTIDESDEISVWSAQTLREVHSFSTGQRRIGALVKSKNEDYIAFAEGRAPLLGVPIRNSLAIWQTDQLRFAK